MKNLPYYSMSQPKAVPECIIRHYRFFDGGNNNKNTIAKMINAKRLAEPCNSMHFESQCQ